MVIVVSVEEDIVIFWFLNFGVLVLKKKGLMKQ